ncbi:MAG: TrmH family RNA methyltransferase [Acidimicrobiales bacterium]
MAESLGASHAHVRRLRRLGRHREDRWEQGACVLEGPDLVSAALEQGHVLEALFVASGSREPFEELIRRAAATATPVFNVDPAVLARVAPAVTPQPLVAIATWPLVALDALAMTGLVLVAHDLRDPGNAGTIIRSADAAGASGVVFSGDSVDPTNPKVLRASAGSIFHLPVAVAPLPATLARARHVGARTWATVVRGGIELRDVPFTSPTVVVIGNESAGLDEATVASCDDALSIAMAGGAESLNAGVAASLIAFTARWWHVDHGDPLAGRSLTEL